MYRFKIDLVDERARDSDDWRMSVQTHEGKILQTLLLLLLISHPTARERRCGGFLGVWCQVPGYPGCSKPHLLTRPCVARRTATVSSQLRASFGLLNTEPCHCVMLRTFPYLTASVVRHPLTPTGSEHCVHVLATLGKTLPL
jgi:hypothetical protein